MTGQRIFLVAGEPSGDQHGAALVRELRELAPEVDLVGLGGHRMEAEGMTLRFDLAEHAIVGFTEVLKHIPQVKAVFRSTVADFDRSPPAAVVLIDYPGFNLRLAREVKRRGIRVIYYISPQLWAWGRGRLRRIAERVDLMLVILPFEEKMYREADMRVEFVGHPLLDEMAEYKIDEQLMARWTADGHSPLLGLLPGSRIQEVTRLLPVMAATAELLRKDYPTGRFLVPLSNDDCREAARGILAGYPDARIEMVGGHVQEVLRSANACVIASGTATVEAAICSTPMVVAYILSGPSYYVARMLVRIEHISLVNILAGGPLVPEFIQRQARPESISQAVKQILTEPEMRHRIVAGLGEVYRRLGKPGASRRAAQRILDELNGAGRH